MNYLSIDDLHGTTYKEVYNTILDLYSKEIDSYDFINLYATLKQYNIINENVIRAYRDILRFTVENDSIDIIDTARTITCDDMWYGKSAGAFEGVEFKQRVDLGYKYPKGLLKGVVFNNGLAIHNPRLLPESLFGIIVNGGTIDLTEVKEIENKNFLDIYSTIPGGVAVYLKDLQLFGDSTFSIKQYSQATARIYYIGTIAEFKEIIFNTLQFFERTGGSANSMFRRLTESPMYRIICYDGCFDFRQLLYDNKFIYYSIA